MNNENKGLDEYQKAGLEMLESFLDNYSAENRNSRVYWEVQSEIFADKCKLIEERERQKTLQKKAEKKSWLRKLFK